LGSGRSSGTLAGKDFHRTPLLSSCCRLDHDSGRVRPVLWPLEIQARLAGPAGETFERNRQIRCDFRPRVEPGRRWKLESSTDGGFFLHAGKAPGFSHPGGVRSRNEYLRGRQIPWASISQSPRSRSQSAQGWQNPGRRDDRTRTPEDEAVSDLRSAGSPLGGRHDIACQFLPQSISRPHCAA
jgi:hypothetical protein